MAVLARGRWWREPDQPDAGGIEPARSAPTSSRCRRSSAPIALRWSGDAHRRRLGFDRSAVDSVVDPGVRAFIGRSGARDQRCRSSSSRRRRRRSALGGAPAQYVDMTDDRRGQPSERGERADKRWGYELGGAFFHTLKNSDAPAAAVLPNASCSSPTASRPSTGPGRTRAARLGMARSCTTTPGVPQGMAGGRRPPGPASPGFLRPRRRDPRLPPRHRSDLRRLCPRPERQRLGTYNPAVYTTSARIPPRRPRSWPRT